MKAKAKCGLISLGCAKNLVDSEVMLGTLRAAGYDITVQESEAEVLIINTCGFIGPAVAESTQAIREAVERKRRGKCRAVIATGCLVQRDVNTLQRETVGVDAYLGLNEFPRIAEVLDQILYPSSIIPHPSSLAYAAGSDSHPSSMAPHPLAMVNPEVWYVYDDTTPRVRATPPWYAYLKISEGCDHRCTFCIIPQMRGDMRSRPIDSIVTEARRLAGEGVKELILIAQDSTRYGMDIYGKPCLADLLKQLAAIAELAWIRVLYAYPLFINDEFVEVMAEHPNICKYIDVPLQHSHPEMLKAMQRAGSPDSYLRMIERLRMRMPEVTIRTTFITGFPGETDVHFSHLKRFLRQVEFDRVAVFQYYPEQESPAAHFANQVEDAVKEERYHELMALQQDISRKRNRRLINKQMQVLLEERMEKKTGAWIGRSERDAPEIDAQVRVRKVDPDIRPGEFVTVRITRCHDYDLEGVQVGGRSNP